jgi:predicted DsbA family dithiol-disulfide isomerase
MKVEIYSDVVCPWCAIGKRRFEAALQRFNHADEVDVQWRSFELDPDAASIAETDSASRLAEKYGMTRQEAVSRQESLAATAALEGLEFHFDRTKRGNTFDAHRLLHLSRESGLQDALKERLFRAYFTEGEDVGNHETLARLAGEVGLDPAKSREILESDRYAVEVRADEREARELGIRGVPFFVIDQQFGISGAQQSDVILEVLNEAWRKEHPLIVAPEDGNLSCDGDSCAI